MTDAEKRVKEMAERTFGTWNWQKAWRDRCLVTDAEGVFFYDDKGKSYLDFSSQFMCSNLGHKNPAIIEAITNRPKNSLILPPDLPPRPPSRRWRPCAR